MAAETVHLIFKTHLDLGFTALAGDVRARYHEDFIPRAIDTAEHFFREDPDRPMFVWTTGAWLIWDHLESAGRERARRLEWAIERGLIRWHALPFTLHSELMTPGLFRLGLGFSRELDHRFGVVTRAAKMTDVPGHSRGIVPLLAEAGVTYLHIGVNEASPVPEVPRMFRWQVEGAEIVVHYDASYGGVASFPGTSTGVAFAHSGDNLGPPGVPQVADSWRNLAHERPEAIIVASSLEPVAEAATKAAAHLPVITAEIGDSWIHGVASDPIKTSRFLSLQRLFEAFCSERLTPSRMRFGRALCLIPEHTWGVDIKSYLRDEQCWDRPAFEAARRSDPRFVLTEASWAEQRSYLDEAVSCLEGDDRVRAGRALKNERQDQAMMEAVSPRPFEVSPEGHITRLRLPDGTELAAHHLIELAYETYDASDIDVHLRSYLSAEPLWAVYDHGKPGLDRAKTARSGRFAATFIAADGGLLTYRFEPELVNTFGAPAEIQIGILPLDGRSLEIRLELKGKPANRMPEAAFLSFDPPMDAGSLRFEKLGVWNDPVEQVARGGAGLQAVSSVRWESGGQAFQLTPLDTSLVMPAGKPFMRYDSLPRFGDAGIAFNLFNNKWGTNFPMWWEGDFVARFILQAVPKLE